MIFSERLEGLAKSSARGGFNDELPGETTTDAFVKGGHGRGNLEFWVLSEDVVGLLDFGENGFFGFVSNGEACEVSKRWEVAGTALAEFVGGEFREVGGKGGLDDRVVGLVGLDDNAGSVEMTPADAADDLGEEFETTFFGGEIGQGESRVGLNHADGGKMRQVEPAGESLGADEDIDFTGFDGLVKFGETAGFFVITIKSGNFSLREEGGEFSFE